jgi:NAD-dependent dihydropyrimidine dehydrogenase PreA subunit
MARNDNGSAFYPVGWLNHSYFTQTEKEAATMKCAVIYFSLTGNTEKIARAIQTGVKLAAGHGDIFPIKEANPRRLYEYDLMGLGSPVIGGVPANVTAFISNMRFLGGKHIFSFCTHCTMGFTFNPGIVPKLKEKGLIVIGWNDWYGHSWGPIHQPTPYPTDGHPDEIDLREAEEFGREMVWRSQKIYAGDTSLIPETPAPVPFPDADVEDILRRLSFKNVVKFHREKCTYPKCRLCMDNCPMDGIDLSVDPPIIARPCLNCTFCEQICPTGAIDGDESQQEILARHISAGLQKVGVKHLAEAEAEGRFRRLLPKEKVGWDTPVYKVHPKHPRFIIGKGPQ